MAAQDVLLYERGVFPVFKTDINATYTPAPANAPPPFDEGGLAFLADAFGYYRVFQFRQNRHGSAMTKFGLESKKILVVSSGTSTTTSITKASVFSATGLYTGAIAWDTSQTAGAGAAPEGQAVRVQSATAAVLTLDANLPFTVAGGATDNYAVISPKIIKSAAGDPNYVVAGVCAGNAALAEGDWGWLQINGLCPRAVVRDSTAFTATHTIKAQTEVIDTNAATTVTSLTFGYAPGAISGNQTGGLTNVFVLALVPGVL